MTSHRLRKGAAVSTLLLMGMSGCKHGEKTPSDAIPSDFSITCGIQGTFAGRSLGYSIDALGEVVQWEGKYPGEIRQATAMLDRKEVGRLWQRAEDIKFLQMKEQAMTVEGSFVTVSAAGESRRATWAALDEREPTPAQTLFDECMSMARTALESKSAGKSD